MLMELDVKQPMCQMKKTIFTAVGLFVLDAFVMNQGAIAVITALAIIFWLLPKSALLKYKRESPTVPLTKAAIYGVMVLAVFIANFANNKIAKYRAESLIVAIEKYHQSTGNYPEKLSDLAPVYIPEVPVAKYTIIFNEFWYRRSHDSVAIFYVALPPFGMHTYSFNRRSWTYID